MIIRAGRYRNSLTRFTACLCLGLTLHTGIQTASAQEYSADGNRWYEVEVIIFANQSEAAAIGERPLPALSNLAYLPDLRELRPAVSSFMIDFPETQALLQDNRPAAETAQALSARLEEFGPRLQQQVQSTFRIDDFARDPYIALDSRFHKLTRELRRLDNSAEYRVLWHSMWRQPMQGIAQTPSVYIHGGIETDSHHELEGSIRLTDDNGSNHMDINVWLSRYNSQGAIAAGSSNEWRLPDLPWQDESGDLFESVFRLRTYPDEVWQIETDRRLESDRYYYLDNPAFGVLLQIRSYQLPVSTLSEGGADF